MTEFTSAQYAVGGVRERIDTALRGTGRDFSALTADDFVDVRGLPLARPDRNNKSADGSEYRRALTMSSTPEAASAARPPAGNRIWLSSNGDRPHRRILRHCPVAEQPGGPRRPHRGHRGRRHRPTSARRGLRPRRQSTRPDEHRRQVTPVQRGSPRPATRRTTRACGTPSPDHGNPFVSPFHGPTSQNAAISSPPTTCSATLQDAGFSVEVWNDLTEFAVEAMTPLFDAPADPRGLQLLVPDIQTKVRSLLRNAREGRLALIQAVARAV